MNDTIFNLLIDYAEKKISFESLRASIHEITGRNITPFMVDEYWGYVDIDVVIDDLLNQEIANWNAFQLQKEVEFIIKSYERENLSLEQAQSRIKSSTGKDIDQYTLDNYWKSENLGNLASRLTVAEISNWADINDEKALQLIQEMMANITNDAILERNALALERRFSKNTGTVINLIFHEDKDSPDEILALLKA